MNKRLVIWREESTRASRSTVWFPKATQNCISALTLWGQVRIQVSHLPTVFAAHGQRDPHQSPLLNRHEWDGDKWGFVLGNYLGRWCNELWAWWRKMGSNDLDIRGSGYCLLLEWSVQSAWAGSILFKGSIQTLNRTSMSHVYVLYWVTLKLWSLPGLKILKSRDTAQRKSLKACTYSKMEKTVWGHKT